MLIESPDYTKLRGIAMTREVREILKRDVEQLKSQAENNNNTFSLGAVQRKHCNWLQWGKDFIPDVQEIHGKH